MTTRLSTLQFIALFVTVLGIATFAGPTTNAFAQSRSSGLPPGPGNPLANLQQQVDALSNQLGGLAGLAVYDANGIRVGTVVSIDMASLPRYPVVVLDVNGMPVPVRVGTMGFVASIVYFTGTGCQGQAVFGPVWSPTPSPLAMGAVNAPGSMFYVADTTGGTKSFVINSYLSTNRACYETLPNTIPGYSAQPVGDLAEQFTPPFTIH